MSYPHNPPFKLNYSFRLSSIHFWLFVLGACWAASASAAETAAADDTSPSVEQRLESVESSFAAVQRKLRMLGAEEDDWLGGDELWENPATLLAYAKKLAGERRHAEAYHLLSLFHAKFSDTDEDKEALRIARGIFGSHYFRTRLHEPQGPWVVAEPYALFQWVNGYRASEDFPELLTSVLRGLPFPFYQDYLDFTERYYQRDFGWVIEVTRDNGIIDSVSVIAVEDEGDAE